MCSTQPNIPMVISFICLGVLGYSGQYPKTSHSFQINFVIYSILLELDLFLHYLTLEENYEGIFL